jgi:hypothetical protein
MTLIGNKDFYLEVAKGNVANHISINLFGRNTDIDSASAEDVWPHGGDWTAPTTNRLHNIASSDANDTSAGTGARTVLVTGLNGSYAVTSESITLNGVANVSTTNSYVFISEIKVTSAGSGLVNAGNITATAQTDATVSCSVTIGKNKSAMGIYQVPAGYTAYLSYYQAGFQNSTGGAYCDVELLSKPDGGVFSVIGYHGIINTGTSIEDDYYYSPVVLTEKTIIKTRATSSANNSNVQVRMCLTLVAN